MASKKVRMVLAYGSAATASFFAGQYYERYTICQKINIPARPALPLYGTVPTGFTSESGAVNSSSFIPQLDKVESFLKYVLSLSFVCVKAATPIDKQEIATAPVTVPTENGTNLVPHASRVSEIMKYGFPGLENVLTYKDFVLSYDKRNRVAHWVFEHLTEKSIRKNDAIDRSKCSFKEEENIHPYFRSRNADYKGSGYDRGHLAAAGNHKISQLHVEETFYLSNMAPQVGKGFNRDSWNNLEKYVRKLTRTYPNVYCCTGPLYLPRKDVNGKMYVKYEVIGGQHVAVPTHFFKIVVGETHDDKLEMECYVMENKAISDDIPLKSFQVPPELVERASGLLFFDNRAKSKLVKINGKKV